VKNAKAMAALDAGIATFEGIAMADVAAKSRSLSQLFIGEVEAFGVENGMEWSDDESE